MKTTHPAEGSLELTINGQRYQWPHEFITGAELKQLNAITADTELFLSVKRPWEDELINNDDRVNLARPEIEHFYCKKKLEFRIDDKPYEWFKQYITGYDLRKLCGAAEDVDIFLAIQHPWEDELIKDDTSVDLARPGIEHFYTKKPVTEFCLIVNAREKTWKEKKISYAQVVVLAFGVHEENDRKVYTVTYKHGPEQNPEGAMVKGDHVFVKNKMIFNVTATDKS